MQSRDIRTHVLLRWFRGASALRWSPASHKICASASHESVYFLPRRSLATRAITDGAVKGTESLGKKEARRAGTSAIRQTLLDPIYPDSKASKRRNPHAPPLFQHFRRHGLGQDPSDATSSKQRISSDTYILRNVSTDPELKQLYTALGKAADIHDAVQATKLCMLIKERKEQFPETGRSVTFDPEEKVVFLAVMRALAHHGLLEEVQAIYADMLSFGFSECIESLNLLLQAAIVSANEDATSAILERIFALQPSSLSRTNPSEELAKLLLADEEGTALTKSRRTAGLTLPFQQTRNWNAATFAHMVDSACQDHNMEFALLLLSTCCRARLTLPHETLSKLISLCLHSEEFRAAVELASLMEEGGLVYSQDVARNDESKPALGAASLRSEARGGQVARRLPPSVWMSILRSCAEGGYLPGVELAWTRAVVQGLLSPDDGLLLAVLALAAKEGSVQMASVCLKHIDPSFDASTSPLASLGQASDPPSAHSRRLSTPAKRRELQEWHLAPLFEAQCSARDYEGAMRTLRGYHHRGFSVTDRTTSRIATSIYPDKASLQLATEALARSATEPSTGTHIAIVNAVLSAAVWLGDLGQALEIYRAIPSYHVIANPDSTRPRYQPKHIKPNLDTYNALLSGCIDTADYETGVELLRDLNQLRIQPDATTFERMIILCLTQRNYDDAFGFIEEAKEKGIPPSRKSYEALVRKCFNEKDHRGERVLADMSDRYQPSPRFLRQLDIQPDTFGHPNPPRLQF